MGRNKKGRKALFCWLSIFMIRIDRNSNNPSNISIFTGDICNLACVTCDAPASTRWQHEIGQQKKQWPIESIIDAVDNLNFLDARSVVFGGGEPILNKSTLIILKKLKSNTPVLIHLNGTVLPTQNFLNECSRFDDIQLVFSIDDIEEQFEFLRYPANWNKVLKNILWLQDNCTSNIRFAFNTVVTVLNYSTHTRVSDWVAKNMSSDIMCWTNENSGFLSWHNYKNNIAKCVTYLDALDTKRKNNWRQVFPNAAVLLQR